MKSRYSALFLFLVLLLGGCTNKPAAPGIPEPAASPVETAAPAPAPSEVGGVPASSLFPDGDLDMTFWVWDMGKPASASQSEQRIREDGTVAVVQNGRPAFAWLLDSTGVWREDPGGGGVLLRYLPPNLVDGAVWNQRSGDAAVWFRLRAAGGLCTKGNGMGATGCWELSVLNRNQELVYTFAPGVGPTEVRAINNLTPADSFLMRAEQSQAATIEAAQRTAAFDKVRPGVKDRAPVTSAAVADYESERATALGLQTRHADLDGDGRTEPLRGLFGTWTLSPVEASGPDGRQMGLLDTFMWAHKVDVVRFRPTGQDFLLVWERGPGGGTAVGVRYPLFTDGGWRWGGTYGWGVKHATTTPATRAAWNDAGLLTVEWEMGDPGGHTRIRQYRFRLDGLQSSVSLEAQRFAATNGELRYPADPRGVLEAAWTAYAFGIPDELARYFGSPAALDAFRRGLKAVDYGSGITLGTPGQVPTGCPYRFTPGDPGADGTATFLVGYPGLAYDEAWGTVKFGSDSSGRLVITEFAVVGEHTCTP